MKFNIFQINSNRDTKRIRFFGLDQMESLLGSKKINSKIYDKIYSGDIATDSLEDIFYTFNLKHPSDYHGTSLSVSDIVEVISSDTIEKGFYFCDSYGFKKVEFNSEMCRK